MTIYADASALLKLYLDEPESAVARGTLRADSTWISSCISAVEVRHNLRRLLAGDALRHARAVFDRDWSYVASLGIGDAAADRAAALAESTGVRSLDAFHLEAAARVGAAEGLPIVTFDRRLADAARSLDWRVLPE